MGRIRAAMPAVARRNVEALTLQRGGQPRARRVGGYAAVVAAVTKVRHVSESAVNLVSSYLGFAPFGKSDLNKRKLNKLCFYFISYIL